MRAMFLEVLIDSAEAAGLGVEHGCLYHIQSHIDEVLRRHCSELVDPRTFLESYVAFQTFVSRMIEDARAKHYSNLHEDTFFAAKDACGIVFWCA
ncbi:MAG: hypothetical protein GTO22_07525 [Gemmatimonadales bacterium]|nr:hypothetical protein [Gemmatimonadales bacterium]